jgi:hypothetical protein
MTEYCCWQNQASGKGVSMHKFIDTTKVRPTLLM